MRIFAFIDSRMLSATARRLQQTIGVGHSITVCSERQRQSHARAAFSKAGLGINQFFSYPSSCRGGFGCFFPEADGCVIARDFQPAVQLLAEADEIIYSVPSLMPGEFETFRPGGFPWEMKAAVDHSLAILTGGFITNRFGQIVHARRQPFSEINRRQRFHLFATGQAVGSLVERHIQRIAERYYDGVFAGTHEIADSEIEPGIIRIASATVPLSRNCYPKQVFLAIGSPRGDKSYTTKLAIHLLETYQRELGVKLDLSVYGVLGKAATLIFPEYKQVQSTDEISNALLHAGLFVCAAPVYSAGFSSGMQRFIDELPYSPGAFSPKNFMLVSSGGLPNADEAEIQKAYAFQLCRRFSWNYRGALFLAGSEMEKLVPLNRYNGFKFAGRAGEALAQRNYSLLPELESEMAALQFVPRIWYPRVGWTYFTPPVHALLKRLGLTATCGNR